MISQARWARNRTLSVVAAVGVGGLTTGFVLWTAATSRCEGTLFRIVGIAMIVPAGLAVVAGLQALRVRDDDKSILRLWISIGALAVIAALGIAIALYRGGCPVPV